MRRLPLLVMLVLLAGAGVAGTRYLLGQSPRYGTNSEIAIRAYTEGESALRRFEFERARDAMLRAVEADRHFAIAHLQLSEACGALGQVDEMLQHLDLASQWADSTAIEEERWRIHYGVALRNGKIGEREHALEQLVRQFPDSEHTLVILAERAKREQDFDRAEELFRRVLQTDPTRVDVHNQLGYIALEQGEYESAVTSLQRYAYYAPDAANPHDSLGEAYLLTGRYHQSWEEYLRALEIDPTFVSSAIGACDAFTLTGQCNRAMKLLDATKGLLIERGRAGLVPVKRMQILYAKRQWSEVVHGVDAALAEELMQLPSTRGQQMWLRALRTLALAKQGQLDLATAHMDTSLSLLRSIQSGLGPEASFVREELELLEASLRAFLAVRTNVDAAARLADLRGLIEASGRRPHRLLPYRTSLSDALFEYGLYEEAIEVAQDLLDFNPRYPHANLIACKSYLRLHRRDEALPHLQRYLEMMRLADEDHPEVAEARRILQQVMPSS